MIIVNSLLNIVIVFQKKMMIMSEEKDDRVVMRVLVTEQTERSIKLLMLKYSTPEEGRVIDALVEFYDAYRATILTLK